MIKLPDREEFIFSLKSFVGAMMALYLAFRIGLPRPFWAPLTAYVVSQPLAGAVRSKALYRVIGTIIGALAIVTLIPTFVNYTGMFALVMGGWFGFCLFMSLMDRTPRSYAFLLGGYTVGFVAMPALADMSTFNISGIFDVALARSEEIILGVLCSTLVHSLVLPKGIGSVILKRLDQVLSDGQQWVNNILTSAKTGGESRMDINKLALIITELRIMSTHLPYDTDNVRWTSNIVRSMQDRFSTLVPVLSAIEDRLHVLYNSNQGTLPDEWQKLLTDISDWIARGAEDDRPENAIRLRRRIDRIIPVLNSESHWEDMLLANLGTELYRLVDICEDCFDLRRKVDIGLKGEMPPNEMREPKVSTMTLYVDRKLALSSAFATAMSMIVSCLFWAASGWPTGFAAPMMAGMYCMFFSTFDNPVPILKTQFYCTLLSSPVSGIYLLWLLPSAHSFEMLMLLLAPFLIWFGTYLSKPATAVKVIPFMFTVLATLTMFDMDSANMTSYINSQISQAIGVGSAAIFMAIFRTASVDSLIRRLVHSIWEDISRLGYAVRAPSVVAVTVKMVDGISLLAPRLALATKTGMADHPGVMAATNILSDLRVGLNMTRLLRTETKLEHQNLSVRPVLERLSEYYRHEKKTRDVATEGLLDEIDMTLYRMANATGPHLQQSQAIAALTGIRRDLFPDALPYSPSSVSFRHAENIRQQPPDKTPNNP
ncbi:FUSC family protein [Oxalobacter sp. OxGP1]|uniref:FUSC family protein n=1 Tax=Oxalobacter paeniformigenes TaxID=2946594 RepID=UPI0022AED618|nr:FUSC family protein [Oxalobacter paeniformigenes]MCZ4052816.1 FUSC family protein [Oxalobacter paeniformigenes]